MKKLLTSLAIYINVLASAAAQEALVPYITCGTSLVSSCILKSAPGQFFNANLAIISGTTWVALIDTATTPTNGTIQAVKWFGPFTGPNYLEVSYNTSPLVLNTGITLACSTGTPPTLTLSAQCLISGGTR